MKPLYFNKLDSLRFWAFFLVFWYHGFRDCFSGLTDNTTITTIINSLLTTGGVGVHIFFVISGFLITYLLIREFDMHKTISIKNFYLRRVLRIWPLYYLVLGTGIFLLPHLLDTFQFNGSLLKNLLFFNNFDMLSEPTSANIGITWSVAIEEQFYLFWPLLFAVFYKKDLLPYVCGGIWLFSVAYILLTDPFTAYFHTFGNLNYLMTGCFGAWLFARYHSFIMDAKWLSAGSFMLGILVIVATIILKNFYPFFGYVYLLLPFVYLGFVFYLVRISDNKETLVFSKLGKYTYGMYLYHPAVLIVLRKMFWLVNPDYYKARSLNLLLALIALSLTIGLSILSYEYFEKIFLRLKRKVSTIETRI
ncbi:MAG: acyltransferase [Bacteroidota bacterium]